MAVPALTPAQLQALSDEQLFTLLPATDRERYRAPTTAEEKKQFEDEPERFIKADTKVILDELWNRHFLPQEAKLRGKLRTLCPRQHADQDGFVDDAVTGAYVAFLRRIKRQRYENFRGYLYTLVIRAGRDKVRKIVGRPSKGKEHAERFEPSTRRKPPEEQLDERTDAVSQGRDPLQVITEEQLKEIIRSILEEHAGDHPLSTLTVVLHRLLKCRDGMLYVTCFSSQLESSCISHRKTSEKSAKRRKVYRSCTRGLFPEFKTLVEPSIRLSSQCRKKCRTALRLNTEA